MIWEELFGSGGGLTGMGPDSGDTQQGIDGDPHADVHRQLQDSRRDPPSPGRDDDGLIS